MSGINSRVYHDACRYTLIPSSSLFLFPLYLQLRFPMYWWIRVCVCMPPRRPLRKSTPLHPVFDLSFSSFRLTMGQVMSSMGASGPFRNHALNVYSRASIRLDSKLKKIFWSKANTPNLPQPF